MNRYFLLIILLCGHLFYGQSTNYQFNHIATSSGLSQSSAIALAQDSLGRMWIGTRDGLNKYDGHSFTIYKNQEATVNSLSNSDILSLDIKENKLWIGTYNGLNKLDLKTNKIKRYYAAGSSKNNIINKVKILDNNLILAGTSSGLFIVDEKTGSLNLTAFKYPVMSIVQLKTGQVYIGTNSGLFKCTHLTATDMKFEKVSGDLNVSIQDVVQSDNLLYLATTTQGIYKYNIENKSLTPFHNTVLPKDIRSIKIDQENNLWAGTYNGAYIYKSNGSVVVLKNDTTNPQSLSKNSIKSLLLDRNGAMWLGTYNGGANVYHKSNNLFKNITEASQPYQLNNSVVSSVQARGDQLYIGTEGGGITIINSKTGESKQITTQLNMQLKDDNIKSLLLEYPLLYIGTYNHGLALYNAEQNLFVENSLTQNINNQIQNIGVYAIKRHKNELYFGTFGKGVFKYNNSSKSIISLGDHLKSSLSSDLVRSLLIDKNKAIWVGTQRGLNKISPKYEVKTYFNAVNNRNVIDILTLFEDSKGAVWVGTKSHGLYKMSANKAEKIALKNNQLDITTIHSIYSTDDTNLWLGTNQGIAVYNKITKRVRLYTIVHGLAGNEFIDNAILFNNNNLYFGGVQGLTFFKSDILKTQDFKAPVIITDFKLRDEHKDFKEAYSGDLAFAKALQLNHKRNSFTISFAKPNFINAQTPLYAYRLRGLEESWNTTSNPNVSYTLQNAGKYIFEVKEVYSDGSYSKSLTTLPINLEIAPWKSWWAILIYLAIVVATLWYVISLYKEKRQLKRDVIQEQKELEKSKQINDSKIQFFTNISHEFRTPLTLILGPLQQILSDYKGSNSVYKKLLVVDSNAKQLLQHINRLMDFRKLEQKQFDLEAAEGNIVKFIKEIYYSFTEYAINGDYDYTFETTNDKIKLFYDRYKLERVFYNLISNAFKYTEPGGKIGIHISKNQRNLVVKIIDSGEGIKDEHKALVFDRFYEIGTENGIHSNRVQGTGLGLNIVKSLVELHKGTITIIDNKPQGSVFELQLPLGSIHLDKKDIITDFKFSDDISQYVNQLENKSVKKDGDIVKLVKKEELPTILVVEDSHALRQFMVTLLEKDYNVLEASNGDAALKMAFKHIPDLIVSDVVMPVMAGTELCAALREDMRTSHIPFILLTSRTALIYKLEGLNNGADDYICKPFDINEFKLRIKNLLYTTNRLKEKFTQTDILTPEDINVPSADEKLFKKAIGLVEDNITNDQFDIPTFCAMLGVSRTMLFIKIKAWTDLTPNEFIHHFRMKRAAQLLELGTLNISEVSYKVGFRNPKYFSKCFHKRYGETPSQYASKFAST